MNTRHVLIFLTALLALVLAACASIGRPQGGPRDSAPPDYVRSTPAQMATNVKSQTIDIYFDENVQLDDAFSKVIVSPAQLNAPAITSGGRRVSVELKDTLMENTTYTIDFGDAIKDLNEGNKLDGFTIAFSTGDSIDSLRISGLVLQAENLEPAQGILVGAYSNLSDTAITTLPMERVARTNQYGQFTIYNLKEGQYHLFAINDVNRDYKWDRSEDIAFLDSLISPWVEPIEVTDTLRGSDGKDSLAVRQGVAYFPNDVLLTWFNEDYKSQYLKDYKRPERNKITVNFAAPSDTLPIITIASGPMKGRAIESWSVPDINLTRDSLQYWITDSAVMATDSLFLALNYLRTDTTDQLSWQADTLKFFFKDPKTKENKKKNKKNKEEETDTLPKPIEHLSFSPQTSGKQDVHRPVVFVSAIPLDSVDIGGIHLDLIEDSIATPVTDFYFGPDSLKPLTTRIIDYEWKDGAKYRLTIDSASVVSIYGTHNKPIKLDVDVKELSEYANLIFNIKGTDSLPAIVELLNAQDKPIATAPVNEGTAEFYFLAPGTVYARLYLDANDNGKWDTGNVLAHRQPEEVFYYPKKIVLRKNWDITQEWDIYDTPVDIQKLNDIKKNKPKDFKPQKSTDDEDDNLQDGGFGYGGYGSSAYGRDPYNTNR